jgi:hypothetical protein
MAAAGVPMRTPQEWMGHPDIETAQRYADYLPVAGRRADGGGVQSAGFGGRHACRNAQPSSLIE